MASNRCISRQLLGVDLQSLIDHFRASAALRIDPMVQIRTSIFARSASKLASSPQLQLTNGDHSLGLVVWNCG